MRLTDNLFHIAERDGTRLRVTLNADHEIYAAHFPGQPVTPGVCIVQMAVELLETIVGKRLRLTEVKRVQYRSMMKPSASPWFSFPSIETTGDGSVKAQAVVADDEREYSRMTILLNEE